MNSDEPPSRRALCFIYKYISHRPKQVHEGGGDVFRGERAGSAAAGGGADGAADAGEPGYFSEFLSAGISRHPIFTDMRFWQHVLSEAVQAKTEKVGPSERGGDVVSVVVVAVVAVVGGGVGGVAVVVAEVIVCAVAISVGCGRCSCFSCRVKEASIVLVPRTTYQV